MSGDQRSGPTMHGPAISDERGPIVDEAVRRAFLARALDAIERRAETLDGQQLQDALDKDTDVAVFRALGLTWAPTHTGFAAATDPLAAARARGEQAKRDLLAAQGDMLTASTVASRLGCTPADVDQRVRSGLLIELVDEYGRRRIPAWQLTETGPLPGLEDVLRDLGLDSPWGQAAFFFSGDIRLDWHTPLETLLRGDIDAVRRAAVAYGEQVPA